MSSAEPDGGSRGSVLPALLAFLLAGALAAAGYWWYREDFRMRFEEPLARLRQPADSLAHMRRDSLLADSLHREIAQRVQERLSARREQQTREDSLGRGAARRLPEAVDTTPARVRVLADDDLDLLASTLRHLPSRGAARMLERLGTQEGARVLGRLEPRQRRALLDSLPREMASRFTPGS